MIYIVMGVSGCGKSTIGNLLAKQLSLPFYDADDFHFPQSIKKMASGTPLTDDDRKPWLSLLANNIADWEVKGRGVGLFRIKAKLPRYTAIYYSR
ncbi:gluconokinase [Paraglaciecola aquimarina]|uniref:gluconokinase n=1 Tax=Paraglaciecola aquimarina TaxID=1235557 RepID=A0ABU3SZJ9_9ALTE|nr:gluconokinase [Paraglaciecola aquimarina]MDU0355382.1 gluconokinase [Paraglaciecola aquimarina]